MTRAERRNVKVRHIYASCATLAGPVSFEDNPQVRFRPVATPGERLVMTLLALFNAGTALAFIGWLLLPAHVPGPGVVGFGGWRLGVARSAFCVVIIVETTRLAQNFAVWVFAFAMKDPVPKAPMAGLRVAVLTTIVPSKEPIHVVERTLKAMLRIKYRGEVDVWILDEGNDPAVKEMCGRLGVHHFSRKGIAKYNQDHGEFRTKTKSGNHNSWRDIHERYYDVVAQMDPDHVPLDCFLERTLGFFRDPDVAFVVAPQVYGNMYNNLVAHGSSVQQYFFSGVVERGGNGLGAPLLIGTNHLYRPSAWREIGGYQDSIIEDHLTSMRVQGTLNPTTGRRWKGVYTPDVLAIGEGPESWTDYFNQQKRWAYGIWEILLKSKLRAGIELRGPQRLLYRLVQMYYPSVAVTLVLGSGATALYLLLGITAIKVNALVWVTLWTLSMASWMVMWFWLRRFNLAEHERREFGLLGMLLALFAGPVYASAAARALTRQPLKYAVTAKGSLKSADSMRTFQLHIFWALTAVALLGVSFLSHHSIAALRIWGTLATIIGFGPPIIVLAGRISDEDEDPADGEEAPHRRRWLPLDYQAPDDADPFAGVSLRVTRPQRALDPSTAVDRPTRHAASSRGSSQEGARRRPADRQQGDRGRRRPDYSRPPQSGPLGDFVQTRSKGVPDRPPMPDHRDQRAPVPPDCRPVPGYDHRGHDA
jgi:cellulose synthase/poly-beta-1,6-N-acetylglucosamine synthase-like glycosyltransferase